MQNILVIYGGKSVEHDISILTALQTMNNINKEKYKIIPLYLTRENKFVIPKNHLDVNTYISPLKKFNKVDLNFGDSSITIKGKVHKKIKIDCAINCCHGFNGEDGTMSAIMNLCDIPLSSADILASSICMDKIIMKDIFVANNIPCVNYCYITENDLKNKDVLKNITTKLQYPLIVKPSNLGSSIGIEKANNEKELLEAIKVALWYDKRVIIEQCLTNFKEINIACLGNDDCILSQLEQPINWKNFLNFDDKYQQTNNSKSKILNPTLDSGVKEEIENFAHKIFKIFNLSGVVRIDFMIDENNKVYVNEINTVPGSLSFYLFKGKNIEFFELIDKLISLAIEKHNKQKLHNYTFKSDVLANFSKNTMNKYSK